MEYHRYLKEVVQALESDPDFRERLEKADEDDVRVSLGSIIYGLPFVLALSILRIPFILQSLDILWNKQMMVYD